jgi:ubiquinone/menaquinone biosynthesis C-methylase UbiE
MATQIDPAADVAAPPGGEESTERARPAASDRRPAAGSGVAAAVVAFARMAPGMTALDLVSGLGELAIPLAWAVGSSGHVTATDPDAGRLAVAAERARGLGLTNLTFRPAKAHELPFPDGAFDRVTAWFGSILGPEVGPVLREGRRVLKPGGRLVVVTSSGQAPNRLAEKLGQAGFSAIEESLLPDCEIAAGTRLGESRHRFQRLTA